jgi:hypothetical protein
MEHGVRRFYEMCITIYKLLTLIPLKKLLQSHFKPGICNISENFINDLIKVRGIF